MSRESVKQLVYSLTKPIPFPVLQAFSSEKFIFPFYHLVAEKEPSYIRHLYPSVTPEQFVADLEFLLKYYQPASADDLKQYVGNGKRAWKKKFFLSFDDGLKECYEIVYPILKEKGIPAAFFINTGFVENPSMFFRFKTSLIIDKISNSTVEKKIRETAGYLGISTSGKANLIRKVGNLAYSDTEKINHVAKILDIDFEKFLKEEKPYMTLDQIKKLDDEGFIIGSHSIDHPLFSELDEKIQKEQFEKSMKFVTSHFNPAILAFAFPFTDYGVNASFFEYLNRSEKVEITFGTAGIKLDSSPKHIQRIPMEVGNRKGASRIVGSEYAYYWLKSFFGRNTIRR
jgi:peptidoglycan/xylan/chitin deacetylase (PgdA/CDA1 family)